MALPGGIKTVDELAVEGKRVFVRVDYNVPLEREASPKGDKATRKVGDDARIRATLPTVKHLIERGARIVLGSHLGRPDGQVKPEYSLEPVAARLAELLDTEVALADEPVGDGARKVVSDLRDGQLAMLENLRWNPGEEANDETFARTLASYCDVYVNDAMRAAAAGPLKGILQVVDEPLVSCDYNGDRHSSSVDAPLTMVVGDQVKVLSWYDNEMGYSQRLYDLAKFVAERL